MNTSINVQHTCMRLIKRMELESASRGERLLLDGKTQLDSYATRRPRQPSSSRLQSEVPCFDPHHATVPSAFIHHPHPQLLYTHLHCTTHSQKTLSFVFTVCVKVMDDLRASMSKEDSRNKPKIEAALGAYCANEDNTLNAREKKICYYIDPIKRDVAQPFSLGMPSLKVCKRINDANPEICTVKFPVQTQHLEAKDLTKLRVKQLKQILSERGVECKGCLEKDEFIKKVQDTEHLAGNEL